MSNFFEKSQTTKARPFARSPSQVLAERFALQAGEAGLAGLREGLRQQRAFMRDTPGERDAEAALREQFRGSADTVRPILDEALALQLEAARRGPGNATPEQLAAIEQARSQQLALAESDIMRFANRATEDIVNNVVAPSGLRPTDTPAVDRFVDVGEEAVRQQAQVSRALAANAANQILQHPLNVAQTNIAQHGLLNTTAQGRAAFEEALAQQAFTNRLQLEGSRGVNLANLSGLGLSAGSPVSLAQHFNNERLAFAPQTTSVSDPFGTVTRLAGGIGGLFTGLGNVGVGFG